MYINTNDIYIIIPCFNEQQTIRGVVNSLLQLGYVHIVVVDDGSATPLQTVLQDLPIIYIRHAANLGQGAALQTGISYARSQNALYAVTFDADGQHRAGDIPELVLPLLSGVADVTMGSRFLAKEGQEVPFSKKIILQLARFINFAFSGMLLSDAHNGLRAFNKKAIDTVVITENRMAHASEILLEIKKHKLQIKEVPVRVLYSHYSIEKGQSAFDSIKILFDLVLHKLFR
ncbi:MAG: glycosyltransferase family 2 protein [Chitinophagaceae bacterium]